MAKPNDFEKAFQQLETIVQRLEGEELPVDESLQAFEKGRLRLERDAVDLVEQDDLGLGQRPELGDEFAGGGVDHLEADDLGGLEVGPSLDANEPRVADGGGI